MFLGGTSPLTGDIDWGTVPTKSVTFTNNSNNKQTIYPFLYSPNNTAKYDPMDAGNDEYRLYIGYQTTGGKEVLGLPYGDSITVSVPLVFWNGGRADIATDGPNLIPRPRNVNDLNPYQFRYTASTFITKDGVTGSTDNGMLMYYRANTPNAPNDPSPAAAGQLTEWTIRDQNLLTSINNQWNASHPANGLIADSELTNLVNYDVSYVDDMTSPVAMYAKSVPVPISYIQNGTATVNGGTTTITLPTNPAPNPAFLTLLTTTYPYGDGTNDTYQWLVQYDVPGSSKVIQVGKVTNISNGVITVTSNGTVSGLPSGVGSYVFYTNSVTEDFGWTGANNDIKQMQAAMADFTAKNTKAEPNKNGLGQYFSGLGWPKYYNPDTKALLKIPSGASVLINSPLIVKSSPYDIHRFLLTSANIGGPFFYNAQEDLDPQGQDTMHLKTIYLKADAPLTDVQLAAINTNLTNGGTWFLSQGPNFKIDPPVGQITSIDTATGIMTVQLSQKIPTKVAYSYLIVQPPNDPYTTKLTNLWYSWANYYTQQFTGANPRLRDRNGIRRHRQPTRHENLHHPDGGCAVGGRRPGHQSQRFNSSQLDHGPENCCQG